MKSDVLYMEMNMLTLQFIIKPKDGTDEEAFNTLQAVTRKVESLLQEIGIIAMATKVLPSWLPKWKTVYGECEQEFNSKLKS